MTLADKDFKGTKKFSWISNISHNITFEIHEFDNILSRADAVDYDGPFMDIVNKNSKFISTAIAEPSLSSLKKGDMIQIERRGQYIVDNMGSSDFNKYKLIYIPDGKDKTMSNLSGKVDVKNMMKGDEKDTTGNKDKKKDKALAKGLKSTTVESEKVEKDKQKAKDCLNQSENKDVTNSNKSNININ